MLSKKFQSVLRETSEFVSDYITSISDVLENHDWAYKLTNTQKRWLSFCLMGLLLSNSINWSLYSRLSLGKYSVSGLSWMFRKSLIAFDLLFKWSIYHVLSSYDLTCGHILFDDTDNERSKNAKHIHGLGKQKDKKSGGYFQGQSILYMVLVTAKITIPIGFKFYENDPSWLKWKQEEDRLRKKKIPKAYRADEVSRDYAKYPTKIALSISLMSEFKQWFPTFVVKSIEADCFYGTKDWTSAMVNLYPTTQVLSQLKSSQIIEIQNKEYRLEDYFNKRTGILTKVSIRGGKSVPIYYSSMIGKVKAHGEKRLIIAYKYEGEAQYRYVFATDMSWVVHHVIATYSLRWLVEVFISDWKTFEGWAVLTKHIGFEGSKNTLILSLLFDHCLILHPQQKARIDNKLPPATVGSLRQNAIQVHLLNSIKSIIESPNPKEELITMAQSIEKVYLLRDSSKHLTNRNFEFT